jgi:hypothetical protein
VRKQKNSDAPRQRIRLDENSIPRMLSEGGWSCDRISDDTWRSHFRGRFASFPFFVRIDPAGYVLFAIVPFVKSPEEPAKSAPLYQKLLTLNQSLIMAKFSIDDDLDVVLSVEYPTVELDRSEFDDALDVLSYYADRHFTEISSLARPPA